MAAITMAQRERECYRIRQCKWPDNDREKCFKILDLHATPRRRNPPSIHGAAFVAHVNAKLSLIAQVHWWPGESVHDQRYQHLAYAATEKILRAIEVVSPFRNALWSPYNDLEDTELSPWKAPVVVTNRDLPLRLHPTKIGVPQPPMAYAAHRAYYDNLPPQPRRPTGGLPPNPQPAIMFSPTPNEVTYYDRERWERWFWSEDGEGPWEGYPRSELTRVGNNRTRIRRHACAGDGNCYWYAIAIALYGIGNVSRFAEVKANIRHFLMEVLNNSSHPRYNTYVHLQANSCVVDTRVPAANNSWGETSLVRCLNRNAHYGYLTTWRPRPTNNLPGQPQPGYCLNQVVADYYDICVVELEESAKHGRELTMEELEADQQMDSEQRVWDIATFRGDLTKRWIYIYNDSHEHFWGGFRRNHFNMPNGFVLPGLDELLDPMPWHPANGPAPADALLPLPAALRHPAVSAPQMEWDHVVAKRDTWWVYFPALPPPAIRDAWISQHPTNPPFPVAPEVPAVEARMGHPPYGIRGWP